MRLECSRGYRRRTSSIAQAFGDVVCGDILTPWPDITPTLGGEMRSNDSKGLSATAGSSDSGRHTANKIENRRESNSHFVCMIALIAKIFNEKRFGVTNPLDSAERTAITFSARGNVTDTADA